MPPFIVSRGRTGSGSPVVVRGGAAEAAGAAILARQRAGLAERRQWLLAMLSYGAIHVGPLAGLPLRSNLHRVDAGAPKRVATAHRILTEAYAAIVVGLSANQQAFLFQSARNVVGRSATPRIVAARLGPFARLDPVALLRDCPFVVDGGRHRPIDNPTRWLEAPGQPTLYGFGRLDVEVTQARCLDTEDWWGDEPYVAVVGAALTPVAMDRLLADRAANRDTTLTPSDYVVTTQCSTPGKDIAPGDDVAIGVRALDNIALRQGLACWSVSLTAFDEDLAESAETRQQLAAASTALTILAQGGDLVAVALAETVIGAAIAEGVALACRIGAGILSLTSALMGLFKDNDDWLGQGQVSETAVRVAEVAPPDPTVETIALNLQGDGARYVVQVEERLTQVVALQAAEVVDVGDENRMTQTMEHGDNDFFTGDKGDDRVSATFKGTWSTGAITIEPLEGYGEQVRKVEADTLTCYHQGQVIPIPFGSFTVPEDMTVVSCKVHWWYDATCVGGTGEARYAWTAVVRRP